MSSRVLEWKPNKRPQSMIAQAFSADLIKLFEINKPGIDVTIGQNIDWESHESTELGDLSQAVEQRRQAVSLQSQELETLEARIRATEDRLKQQGPVVAPTPMSNTALSGPNTQAPNGDLASLRSPPQQQRQETRKDDAIVTSVATSHTHTDPEHSVAAPARPLATSQDCPGSIGQQSDAQSSRQGVSPEPPLDGKHNHFGTMSLVPAS